MRTRLLAAFAAMFMMVLATAPVRADTIGVVYLPGASTPAAGLYSYEISITAGNFTDPASTITSPVVIPSSIGGDIFDSFTIWNFPGFLGVAANTTTFGPALTGAGDYGATSSGQVADATAVVGAGSPNVIFKNISGASFGAPLVPVVIGTVTLISSYTHGVGASPTGYFTSKDSGTRAIGSATVGGGPLFVPVVPLPAAAWMGMALLGSVGGVGFFRKRRQTAL